MTDEYGLHHVATGLDPQLERWFQAFPSTWTKRGTGTSFSSLMYLEVKTVTDPVNIFQYPIPLEAEKGITPHIRRLLDLGVLRSLQSVWNTLLLPVKKLHTNDYRLVQDMWEVNKRVVDTHPTVPNAYNLLSSMSSDWQWYTTVLDLKGPFFSLSLAPKDPPYFALNGNPEISNSDKVT